jgi:hypothetical protein
MLLFFLLSCQSEESKEPVQEERVVLDTKNPKMTKQLHKKFPPNAQNIPSKGMGGLPPIKKGESGGAMQDPSGFPNFHDWPAPKGPPISQKGPWKTVKKLTGPPYGGYRPQITAAPSGELHVLFYDRRDEGDIIHHRRSFDGVSWTDLVDLGHESDRNWGPDIVSREDGSVVVVYDHALPDFRSRGFLTEYSDGVWSKPEALTPDDGGEIGSGHVANAVGTDLAYIFIGKKLGPEHKFQARWRWRTSGTWSSTQALSDGVQDAWHTNVERRPDGSVLAGYDIGMGGGETTLYVVDGRDGSFGKPENITKNGAPGERPHFAFSSSGMDYITWFHKERGQPKSVYVRSGTPGNWGVIEEPSKGFGGFHFDPDIAINVDGDICLVWGWDAGSDAELVYSINKDGRWSPPQKVADIDWGKPGLPSLDVDEAGNFHVVWNQGVRGKNEIYYAQLENP